MEHYRVLADLGEPARRKQGNKVGFSWGNPRSWELWWGYWLELGNLGFIPGLGGEVVS